jgi:hypothetical protein
MWRCGGRIGEMLRKDVIESFGGYAAVDWKNFGNDKLRIHVAETPIELSIQKEHEGRYHKKTRFRV